MLQKEQRKRHHLQHGHLGANFLLAKVLPERSLFLGLQAAYAPARLDDDLQPQQLLLGGIQFLHQLAHAVASDSPLAGLAQPDDVIEYGGRSRFLSGTAPPCLLDEVNGTQMPGIPVRQLGFLQTGDIGRLGPPPCNDAFCIADIILEYLFQVTRPLICWPVA